MWSKLAKIIIILTVSVGTEGVEQGHTTGGNITTK